MNYQLIIGVESAVLCLIAISFFLYYRKIRKEAEEFSSMLEQTKKMEGRLEAAKQELNETRKTEKELQRMVEGIKQEISAASQEKELKLAETAQAVSNHEKAVQTMEKARSVIAEAKKNFDAIKKETLELQDLKKNADKIRIGIQNHTELLGKLKNEIVKHETDSRDAKARLQELMSRIDLYSRLEEFTAFGHFEEPEYLYETSARFTEEIKINRDKQKALLSSNSAITCPDSVSITSDPNADKKIISGQINLMLTAFNIECDFLISKVKPSNFSRTLEQIEKLAAKLEKNAATLHCGFNTEFVRLKYEECKLQYQFRLKKEEEREEQRLINEQMREEVKAQKEYEKAIAEAEKEERMYRQLLEKAKESLTKANQEEQIILQLRIDDLEKQLAEAVDKEERAKSMAEQTRRGYVYVISNVGSFGKNVYKIGLTRRLDPIDRVNELGDASVPFKFDVHAIIHADDAPALEATLHREFKYRRINAVNLRKEFFNVSLEEIKNAAEKIVGNDVDFTMSALAEEYYETRRLQQEMPPEVVT